MPAVLPPPILVGADPLAILTDGLKAGVPSGPTPPPISPGPPRAIFVLPTRSFLFALPSGGGSVIATPQAGTAWIGPDENVAFDLDMATGQGFGTTEVLTGFATLPNSVANPTVWALTTSATTLAPAIITAFALTSPLSGLAVGSSGGTGYPNAGTISFTGGGGTDAAGTYTASGGVVTSVTLTNPGKAYSSVPTPVLSGGGSGAVITVSLLLRRVTVQLAGCVGGSEYVLRCACTTSYGRTVELEASAIPCRAIP